MLGLAEITALLPHGKDMVLLDAVQDWDDKSISCLVSSHKRGDNPLRRPGGLSSVCAVEYALQAVMVHAGLISDGQRREGRLGALRRLDMQEDWLNLAPGLLTLQADLKLKSIQGLIYSFSLGAGLDPLVSGELTVYLK